MFLRHCCPEKGRKCSQGKEKMTSGKVYPRGAHQCLLFEASGAAALPWAARASLLKILSFHPLFLRMPCCLRRWGHNACHCTDSLAARLLGPRRNELTGLRKPKQDEAFSFLFGVLLPSSMFQGACLTLGCRGKCPLCFYIAAGDLNSGRHACTESTLQTEPFPQTQNMFLTGRGKKVRESKAKQTT